MSYPILTIEDGRVKGKIVENSLGGSFYSFSGIPYGKAPVGHLRFKAPLPAEPWSGLFDATKEGPECPARHIMFLYNVGAEDNCLNLNVYTNNLPKSKDDRLKAVMVWIHGGAFFRGSNKTDFYGPDYLMTEDIILVTINYRLGIFGFLSLEDPSLDVPGNAGMKDMVLALKWVKNNIIHFGGDPNNVTIFGESAGGASVHLLCLSPLTKGLFHKAIVQSGCALNSWAVGKNSNGKEAATLLGLEETDENKILEYLQSASTSELISALNKIYDDFAPGNQRFFAPLVEKLANPSSFLSKSPIEIMKSGEFEQVPMIIGYNENEGAFIEVIKWSNWLPIKTINFENEIDHTLAIPKGTKKSKEIAVKIKQFYKLEENISKQHMEKFYSLKTDNIFLHGIHRTILNHLPKTSSPIYHYRMSAETSNNYINKLATVNFMPLLFVLYFLAYWLREGMLKNVCLKLVELIPRSSHTKPTHGDDLGYLFKLFFSRKLEPLSIEEIMVKKFVKLWTNFAKSGNPTPEIDPLLDNVKWKAVTKDDKYFLDIGLELKLGIDPEQKRMEFWDQFYD